MSRFSGLPEPRTTSHGARFADLPDQLASMSRPERFDRIRADSIRESCIDAANHRDEMARLGAAKSTTAKPTAAAPKKVAPAKAAPSKPAASAAPKPVPLTIPADVAARGPEAVAAFKRGHARAEARLAALAKHPAAVGRSAEVLSMFRAGKSDTEIVDHLTKGERAAKSDALWARAIAKVHGRTRDVAADQPQQASKAGNDRIADLWDRARAKVTGQQGAAS